MARSKRSLEPLRGLKEQYGIEARQSKGGSNSVHSPVDRFSCGVSLNTTRSLAMRRGLRLVAGVGLFPADRCRWHRRAYVAGLDHRYGWSPAFPLWLNVLGFILIWLGYAFASWALGENRFFFSTVRIETDRGHVVCDSGPYRIVRHRGYRDYARRVPYRLIPGISFPRAAQDWAVFAWQQTLKWDCGRLRARRHQPVPHRISTSRNRASTT